MGAGCYVRGAGCMGAEWKPGQGALSGPGGPLSGHMGKKLGCGMVGKEKKYLSRSTCQDVVKPVKTIVPVKTTIVVLTGTIVF